MSLKDWSKELNILQGTLLKRFSYGWSIEETFSKPIRLKNKQVGEKQI
jgi:hypothetical protein